MSGVSTGFNNMINMPQSATHGTNVQISPQEKQLQPEILSGSSVLGTFDGQQRGLRANLSASRINNEYGRVGVPDGGVQIRRQLEGEPLNGLDNQ